MPRIKKLLSVLCISVLLCGCGSSNSDTESNANSSAPDTTEASTVQENTTIPESPTEEITDNTFVNTSDSALPEEAEKALLDYLKCDSYEALADSIYPSSIAEEMKNDNLVQGNYFFALYPSDSYEDLEISECIRRTKEEAENLAAFWAMGVSLQGVSADFSAEEGCDVVASATYTIYGEMETMKIRFTNRLTILKIINDRWIIIPSSDMETNSWDLIESIPNY